MEQDELMKQYDAEQERLKRAKDEAEEVIAEQERLLASIENELSEVSRKQREHIQDICKHSLRIKSWELDKSGIEIIVSQKCIKCNAVIETLFGIEEGKRFLNLDQKPDARLVYFLNPDSGGVYTVDKEASTTDVMSMHIRELHLHTWRQLREEGISTKHPLGLVQKQREVRKEVK